MLLGQANVAYKQCLSSLYYQFKQYNGMWDVMQL